MIASTTVRYLVYCAIFFLPSVPSLDSLSSAGIAIVRSWSMIEAVMYGVILSANIVKLLNAPPENRLNRAKSPVSLSNVCARISLSMPGTGICEPILKINSIARVKIIFFLRSGMFQAFATVLNISIRSPLPFLQRLQSFRLRSC